MKNTKKTNFVQNMMDKLDKVTKGKAKLSLAAAAVVVVLVIAIVAVSGNPLYGTYKTGDLLYLSPLSFDHRTLYEENFEEIKLSAKEFSYTYAEEVKAYEKPEYSTEDMTEETLEKLQNAVQDKEAGISFDGATKVHYITTREATSDRYMLVEFEDTMWYVVYHMVGDRMSIWHIIDLK